MYVMSYGDLLRRIPGAIELINKPKLRVLYLHGLNSGQWGKKSITLGFSGYDVETPKLPGNWATALANKIPFFFGNTKKEHWAESTEIIKETIEKHDPEVVVGSSMGGALAMAMQGEFPGVPMILIAPAWRTFGVEPKIENPCIVFHANQDSLVALKDSKELVEKNPKVELRIVEDDHRVNKHLDKILAEVENYAVQLGKPTPKPMMLKGYEAVLYPGGYMKTANGDYLFQEHDEVIIDPVAMTIKKVQPVVVYWPGMHQTVAHTNTHTLAPNRRGKKKPPVDDGIISIRRNVQDTPKTPFEDHR